MMEVENASAKIYYARHMHGGLGGYDHGTVLIDTDAVKAMLPTFEGRNIYINHQDFDNPDPKSACGYVVDSFYNPYDSWAWAKIVVNDVEAQKAIEQKGWTVSNAYKATEFGPGGTKTNVPYDREIRNGVFDHLAIVANPRYENAKVMTPAEYRDYNAGKKAEFERIHNSKTTPGAKMFDFFKNKTTREAVTEIDADTMVDIKNDAGEVVKTVKFADLVAAKEADDAEKARIANAAQPTGKVMFGGKEYDMAELVAIKNAADEAAKETPEAKATREAAEAEATRVENERVENERKAKEAGKENFNELMNAGRETQVQPLVVATQSDRLALGKKLF